MTSYSNVQKQQLSHLGAYLQEKRQEQEKSLEDISLQTYIRVQLLKAVETGDTTDLPQPIFVQGFIRRYADALGLDGTNFAKQFPVHSIPNTPRPVPRPATQVDMSYQTAKIPQTPPVQTPSVQPKAKTPKPAVGAMPTVSEPALAKAVDTGSTAEQTSTATRNFSLDSRPSSDELAAVGLSPSADDVSDTARRSNSLQGSLFDNGGDETPPLASPSAPSPSPVGASLPSTSQPNLNWLPWGIGAAIAVVAMVLLLPNIFGNRSPQETEPVEAEVPVPEQVETVQTPEPEPEPPVSTAPVSVTVEVTEAGPSWMSVAVDDEIVFEGLMEPGMEETWEGQAAITMNVGNAGAALVSFNGGEPTPAGNPGAAEFLTFTPAE